MVSVYQGDGAQNFTGGSDPQVDRLIELLSTEADHEAAAPLANEIDALLWADLFTIPLFQMPTLTAWGNDVEGVVPNATSAGTLWNSEEFRLVR